MHGDRQGSMFCGVTDRLQIGATLSGHLPYNVTTHDRIQDVVCCKGCIVVLCHQSPRNSSKGEEQCSLVCFVDLREHVSGWMQGGPDICPDICPDIWSRQAGDMAEQRVLWA